MTLSLPDALRLARKRLGKSQGDVARDLGFARATISDFECGYPHKLTTARLVRTWLLRNGVLEDANPDVK